MTTAAEWVAFLNARLDEDEEAARDARACAEVKDGRWFDGEDEINDDNGYRLATVNHPFVTTHIARHDPDRTLREVAAKRAMLSMFLDAFGNGLNMTIYGAVGGFTMNGDWVLRQMAAVYSDHPDYREN